MALTEAMTILPSFTMASELSLSSVVLLTLHKKTGEYFNHSISKSLNGDKIQVISIIHLRFFQILYIRYQMMV